MNPPPSDTPPRKRVVISKQCDHDIGLLPFWYHWYKNVFKADQIIITPVKTSLSEIFQTRDFYQGKDVSLHEIEIESWDAAFIWEEQRKILTTLLKDESRSIVVSADTDQFLEPPALLDSNSAGQTQVYRRINVVSDDIPTVENFSKLNYRAHESDQYIAGYVDTLDNPNVKMTGHFTGMLGSSEMQSIRNEYHLHLHGFHSFHEKVKHLAVNQKTNWSGHWKQWRAVLDEQGEEGLRKEYERWVKRLLGHEEHPALAEQFVKVASAKEFAAQQAKTLPDLPSSVVELPFHYKTPQGENSLLVRIPMHEMYRVEEVINKKGYSFPILPHFRDGKTPPVVLDIGANVGLFSLYLKTVLPHAAIHCFEPHPGNGKLLRENLSTLDRILIHPVALSNLDGQAHLHVHAQSSGGHSLRFHSEHYSQTIPVPVRSAKKALQELRIERIQILKIDTEGSEIAILESLSEVLPQTDIIMLEYHSEKDRRIIDFLLQSHTLFACEATKPNIGVVKYIHSRYIR